MISFFFTDTPTTEIYTLSLHDALPIFTPPLPGCIVFLVQAEVADRLAARPGSKTYGALSVGVQAVCRVERLFAVRAGAFTPPPKVQSALVRLTPLAQPPFAPDEIVPSRAFVTACFMRRRKQL